VFKRTKVCSGVLAAMGGMLAVGASPVLAQETQRIEITGSAIKRVAAETAVPITVIRSDELKQQGITSVEQVISVISAVQMTQNMASAIGSGTGGASYADMRALGFNKTLVLLNGQRIANNAVSGTAPDLNMIPFSAIDRVEVLRDGASSLYGTDAIGGVINFITRRDFTGGTIGIGAERPEKDGGKTDSAEIGFGFGNLQSQGFNVFGTLSFKKRDYIRGNERDFNKRIVGGLSNSAFPANYQTVENGPFYNPAAPACAVPNLIPNPAATGCRIVTPPFVSISPKSETVSGFVKGTFAATSNLNLGAEVFYANNKVETQIAPVPYGGYYINPNTTYFPADATSRPGYDPAFNPYGGIAGAPFNNPTPQFPNPINAQAGGVLVWWRDMINGPRSDLSEATQYRVMFTADGNAAGWDYKAALAYNHTKNDRSLTGGYANGDVIGEGILRGIINPFGPQTAAAEELIRGAANVGLLSTSIGKVTNLNVSASRELGDWFGATRPAAVAVGAEYRREDYVDFNHREFAIAVSASTGVDPDARSEGKRDVSAVFAELNVPLLKSLDVTASVRYDKYSDFGSSTNPKLSFRFQPTASFLVRGSASTGFRAPSLYELNATTGFTNTGTFNHPLNCPNGVPIDPTTAGGNCDQQFQAFFGGNKNLEPEESKSYSLGLVFEPFQGASVNVDLWAIEVENIIGSIAEETLFNPANFAVFSQYFKFVQPGNALPTNSIACANGPTSPSCGYVDERQQNLGGIKTNGVDVGFQYRTNSPFGRWTFDYQGTYVAKYEYQDYKNGPWNQNVGVYSGAGPVFRWQHNAGLRWTMGMWGAGLAVHHKSGYVDQIPTNTVSEYTTADAYVTVEPLKGLSLLLGVRNLADKEPPFSNQTALFQSGGWDSRFYDPVGRTVYARANYRF
jgi:iron complex outermembrane receptor protein